VLGTAGERLALQRVSLAGTYEDAPFEAEFLRVVEVDADGRIVAAVGFAPDDCAAAFEELWSRFAAGEGAGCTGVELLTMRHFNGRAWDEWQRSFADDFVVRDHRTLGLSELPARDWLASLRAWVELAPDVRVEVLRVLGFGPRGVLFLSRAIGTHEGGPFEQEPALALVMYRGPLIERCEFFDAADAERALAHLAELEKVP
jgi:hypothetical protein